MDMLEAIWYEQNDEQNDAGGVRGRLADGTPTGKYAELTVDGYSGNVIRIQKTRYTHEAMIDVIIANPGIQAKELAKIFDRTPQNITMLMGSDAFQGKLAERRKEIIDPTLVLTVNERLNALATLSSEVVMDKLQSSQDPGLALKTLEVSVKALGYGARPQTNVAVQTSFVVAMPAKSISAEEWAAEHGR